MWSAKGLEFRLCKSVGSLLMPSCSHVVEMLCVLHQIYFWSSSQATVPLKMTLFQADNRNCDVM